MFGLIGNFGPWELVFILVIVLIIFGPGKLPNWQNPWAKPLRVSRKPNRMIHNRSKKKRSKYQRMQEETCIRYYFSGLIWIPFRIGVY